MENFLNFCKSNYLYIEIAFLVLFAIFLTLFIISVVKRKRLSNACDQLNEEIHNYEDQIMSLKSANSEYEVKTKENLKTIQTLTEGSQSLNESIDVKNKEIDSLKEKNASFKLEIENTTKKLETVNNELTDTKKELAEKETQYEANKAELELVNKKFETTKTLVDDLSKNVSIFEDKNKAAELKVKSLTENLEKLEKEYFALQKEYDTAKKETESLKDIEIENKILLKTIKRLQEKDSMEPVKSETEILNEEEKPLTYLEINNMSRSELFDTAKKYGFSNFALWSNEKLKNEIKSKL